MLCKKCFFAFHFLSGFPFGKSSAQGEDGISVLFDPELSLSVFHIISVRRIGNCFLMREFLLTQSKTTTAHKFPSNNKSSWEPNISFLLEVKSFHSTRNVIKTKQKLNIQWGNHYPQANLKNASSGTCSRALEKLNKIQSRLSPPTLAAALRSRSRWPSFLLEKRHMSECAKLRTRESFSTPRGTDSQRSNQITGFCLEQAGKIVLIDFMHAVRAQPGDKIAHAEYSIRRIITCRWAPCISPGTWLAA